MRSLFLTRDALDNGVTMSMLKWGVVTGRWRRLGHGVYAEGPEEPTDVDLARARVLTRGGEAARGLLAGVLHGLDSVSFRETPTRHQRLQLARHGRTD